MNKFCFDMFLRLSNFFLCKQDSWFYSAGSISQMITGFVFNWFLIRNMTIPKQQFTAVHQHVSPKIFSAWTLRPSFNPTLDTITPRVKNTFYSFSYRWEEFWWGEHDWIFIFCLDFSDDRKSCAIFNKDQNSLSLSWVTIDCPWDAKHRVRFFLYFLIPEFNNFFD